MDGNELTLSSLKRSLFMGIIGKMIDVYRVISKPEKHDIKTEENLFDEITIHEYDECHVDWRQDTFLCNSEIINDLAIHSIAFRKSKISTFAGIMEIDILAIDKLSYANTPYIWRKNLYDFSTTLDENGKIRFSSYEDFQKNKEYLENRARLWDESCWDIYVQKWNNKICIHNSDAAHHLAAVQRQCHEQNLSYYLKSKVYFETIDYTYLENTLNDYDVFYSERENINFVQECYRAFYGEKNFKSKIYYKDFIFKKPVLLLKKGDAFNEKLVNYLCSRKKEFITVDEIVRRLYLKN